MTGDLSTQKFNDDLLLDPQDRATARQGFPALFHVVDDEELRALFKTFNEPANRAKRRILRFGILAVLLVMIALFGTSAERIYDVHLPFYAAAAVACLSALLALIGVLIGLFGLMIGKAKREWLYQRMAGKLLRQFHFQIFVCRTDDIPASRKGKTEKGGFLDHRKKWLAEFRLRFLPHLEARASAAILLRACAFRERRPRGRLQTNGPTVLTPMRG